MSRKRINPLFVIKRSKATLNKPTIVAECENWESAKRVVTYLLEVSEPCSLTVKKGHIARRAANVIYADKDFVAPNMVGPRIPVDEAVFK